MNWIDLQHQELDRICREQYESDRQRMLTYYTLHHPKLLRDAAQMLHLQRWMASPSLDECKFFIFESIMEANAAQSFVEKYETLIPKDVLLLYVFAQTPQDHRMQTLIEQRKIFRSVPWSMQDIAWFVQWLEPVQSNIGMPFLLKALEKNKKSDTISQITMQQASNWTTCVVQHVENLIMLHILPTKGVVHSPTASYTLNPVEQRVFSNLMLRSNIFSQQTQSNPYWNNAMLQYMSVCCPDIREWTIFANLLQEVRQDDLRMHIQNLQHRPKDATIECENMFPETSIFA